METFKCLFDLLSGWVRRAPTYDYLSGLEMQN